MENPFGDLDGVDLYYVINSGQEGFRKIVSTEAPGAVVFDNEEDAERFRGKFNYQYGTAGLEVRRCRIPFADDKDRTIADLQQLLDDARSDADKKEEGEVMAEAKKSRNQVQKKCINCGSTSFKPTDPELNSKRPLTCTECGYMPNT